MNSENEIILYKRHFKISRLVIIQIIIAVIACVAIIFIAFKTGPLIEKKAQLEKDIVDKGLKLEELKMEEESFRDHLKDYIIINLKKDDLNDLKSFLSEDEISPLGSKELTLFLFKGLTKDSFDLVPISTSLIPKIDILVDDAIARYTDDLSIQIENTKMIRSLYWASGKEEQFLKKWGSSIERLEKLFKSKSLTRLEEVEIYRLCGLYYSITDLDHALLCFDNWYKIATPEEKVKIEYNRSRVYSTKKDFKKVIDYARNSFELAQGLKMNFWQAAYVIGFAYAKLNEFENAASEFLVASEVAQKGEEAEIFKKYLQEILTKGFLTDIQKEGLWSVPEFKSKFGKLIE
ncbi:MAG: hypothetical protein JSV96_15160 [Candidatus Aminicenantes bacterium]|nr:MAG: hypothetical protein JSV96_15160 [Candidatus Aminicenantes bacterium]